MAYGRMVAKTIATDSQLRELSDGAYTLYLSMIPFLDRDGRFYANTNTIKGVVVPFRKSFTNQSIGKYVREMERVGLVKVYGKVREYMEFKGFLKNNAVHKNEADSTIPPSNLQEITGNYGLNRIERNRIEKNRIELNGKLPESPSLTREELQKAKDLQQVANGKKTFTITELKKMSV